MGLLAKEALRLNEWYVKRTVTGLPFVILKIAATLDGKIATRSRESAWISSEQARAFSHRLRSRVDAVFTGIGTVRGDDPRLTARHGARPYRRQPARIVADSHLTISSRARVLGTGRAIIATTTAAPRSRLRRLEDRGVEVWSLRATRAGEVSLRAVLERAGSEGLTSILVEGGEHLNASLLKGRLVDKILVFLAPKVMGGGGSVDAVGDLGVKHLRQVLLFRDLSVRKLGPDVVVEAYVVKNHRPLAFGH
jgi:diaminohydroxyphosphoribosylaminopyrimidine deaminase/5-amino-6-(5-phosphoribosylamino)uracil reductase